jgi:hypothetical protein
MKLISKLSALGAVIVLSTAFASADTIASSASSVSYEGYIALGGSYPTPGSFAMSAAPSYDLNNVTPIWDAAFAGSSWVGMAPTAGPSGTVNPAQGYYLFAYTYTGASGSLDSLNVYADDTTSVWLNGAQIIMNGTLGSDAHCSDNAPSCINNKYGSLASSVAIASGDTLYFVVQQKGSNNPGGTGNPSGVDFLGSTTPMTPAPEPSSLLLLGTGLMGSAGMLMRRMRAARS